MVNGIRLSGSLLLTGVLLTGAAAQEISPTRSVAGAWTGSGEDRQGHFEGETLFGAVDVDGRVTFSGTRVYAGGSTRRLAGEGFATGDRLVFTATLAGPTRGIAGRLGGATPSAPQQIRGSYRLTDSALHGEWLRDGGERGTETLTRQAAPQRGMVAAADRRLQRLTADSQAFFSGTRAELYLGSMLATGYRPMLDRQAGVVARREPDKTVLVNQAEILQHKIELALNSLDLDPETRRALGLRRDAAEDWASRIETRWTAEQEDAQRFARRSNGISDWTVEKKEHSELHPLNTGRWLSTGYNTVTTGGLNELRKLDLDPILSKQIDALVTKHLPAEVPENYRKAVANELTRAVADHPYTSNVTNALENLLIGVSDFLYTKATFRRVRADEENEASGPSTTESPAGRTTNAPADPTTPAAAAVDEATRQVEESAWKLRNEFSVDVKPVWDWSVRMIDSITLADALKLEREGLSTGVYARLKVDHPLARDASTAVTTGLEVGGGGFDAHLRNTLRVSGLYTNPSLDSTEVALDASYTSPNKRVATTLNGKINIPLGEDPPAATYEANAKVTVHPTPALALATAGRVHGTLGDPVAWAITPSLAYTFDEGWLLTANGTASGVGGASPNYAAELGLSYMPNDALRLSANSSVNWSPLARPQVDGTVSVTWRP